MSEKKRLTPADLIGEPEKKRKGVPAGFGGDTGYRKPVGAMGHKTEKAKLLFLYGNGDGKPVTSAAVLREKTGVALSTLESYLPVWRKEAQELAIKATGGHSPLVVRVTMEQVTMQAETVKLLESEVIRLRSALHKMSPVSLAYADTMKTLIATLKQWETSSGFADHAALQATIAKEQVKRASKAAALTPEDERQAKGFDFNVKPLEIGDTADA